MSDRHRPRFAITAVLAVLAMGAAACSSEEPSPGESGASTTTTDTTSSTATTAAADGDFYAVPDPLPLGEPGDVIKSEPVEAPGLNGDAYRVMYHSQSLEGDDIAVTGLVAVPESAPPDDGYPVVSWAHGTTGIADQCAPSKDPADANFIAVGNQLLDQGYLAVGTDYEGLGTPGRHPYIVGESEARGVIDIVRAARNLDFAHASREWLAWGHSQGGHAALWAAEVAPAWAPELDLMGTVAGAPPSQLRLIYEALKASPFRYYLLMAGAGFAAAYPDLDLADVATDLALSKLDVVDEGCEDAIADAYADDTIEDLLRTDPYTLPDWKEAIDAQEPGTSRTEDPILIIHGGSDEQIPVVSSELLLDRMCGFDQVVTRRVYEGQSHAGVIGVSLPDMLTWMADRFAGTPAPNDCADAPPV